MCNDLVGSLWNESLWLWRDAIAIISLDGVRPFFQAMAITIRDPQSFQDALRATIQGHHEAYVLTGHQLGSPDPRHAPTRAMITHGLASVAQTLDQHERTEMKHWLLNIYSPAPSLHPSANRYSSALWDWVREYYHRQKDVVGFAAPDQIETRFRESQRTAKIEEDLDQARARTLSPWDQSIYELAGYGNDPHRIANQEARDPYGVVQATILMDRFRRFWLWLLGQATTEQMLTLRRFAIEQTRDAEAKWGALPPLCDPDKLFP